MRFPQISLTAGVLLALAIAPVVATAQDAATAPASNGEAPPAEFIIDAQGWKGGAFRASSNGPFSDCRIAREYDNGTSLIFGLATDGSINAGITNPEWAFESGERFEARVRIDELVDGTGPAVPASRTTIIIPLGAEAQLINALQRGRNLYITVPQGDFTYPLTGTMAGLNALTKCIDKAKELIAANSPIVMGSNEPDPESAGAQGFGMTIRAMAELLRDSGVEGFAIARPDGIRRDPLQLNHAWQTGALIGGLHQEIRTESVDIDGFADRYVAHIKPFCESDLRVELQPAEIKGLYALKRGIVSCTTAEGPTSLALLFTLDSNFYSAFFHQSALANEALAVAETDKVAAHIQALLDEALAADEAGGGEGGVDGGEAPTDAPAPEGGDAPAETAPSSN